jgi:hypothetical protein
MFAKEKEPSPLDKAIDRAFIALSREGVNSEEYGTILNRLTALHEMKEKPSRVSKEAMMNVASNLLGIILILRHEHVNVITSRAMNFVQKIPR